MTEPGKKIQFLLVFFAILSFLLLAFCFAKFRQEAAGFSDKVLAICGEKPKPNTTNPQPGVSKAKQPDLSKAINSSIPPADKKSPAPPSK